MNRKNLGDTIIGLADKSQKHYETKIKKCPFEKRIDFLLSDTVQAAIDKEYSDNKKIAEKFIKKEHIELKKMLILTEKRINEYKQKFKTEEL